MMPLRALTLDRGGDPGREDWEGGKVVVGELSSSVLYILWGGGVLIGLYGVDSSSWDNFT